MSNYKIHIDKPLPPIPDIESHQDFDGLYQKYRSARRFEFWRNLYKKPTYFAALVGLIAVGYLVVESAHKPDQEARWIAPPLPAFTPDYAVLSLAETEETSLSLSPETELVVPAGAFVDANGRSVDGKIDLHYRELREPWEIFLAGVPMHDDSVGKRHLASAAMIEVLAYQNGKPVFLKADQRIRLRYLAADPGLRHDHYFLDTAAHQWAYQGRDELIEQPVDRPVVPARPTRPALLEVRDMNADVLIEKAVAIPPVKPGKPIRVSIGNVADFPEMRGYEDVYWEKLDDSHANDPNREKVTWGAATLRKGRGDTYVMRFIRRENGREIVRTVTARPMFRADSSAAAEAIYRERLAAYESALADFEKNRQLAAENGARADALAAEREAAEKAYLEALRQWEAKYGAAALAADSDPQYVRQVVLHQLGIHSLGKTLRLPETKLVLGVTLPENEADTKDLTLYLSLQEAGTLVALAADEAGTFSLPVELASVSRMWLMNGAGRLARVTVEEEQTQKSVKLNGEWVEIPATAESDHIRSLLEL